VLGLVLTPEVVIAQTKVPLEGQSGIIEKSLEQSRPFIPVPDPGMYIESSKTRKARKDPKVGPLIFVKKIKLTGNTVFSDEILMPLVDLGEGKNVTLGTLTILADKVSAFYAKEGYLLATAFIPKQEVKDGIVEMVITEGRVNKVIVQGNKKLSEEKFKQRMKMVQEEAILREQTLERVLLELNELMGVKVRAVLKPGDLPGTSDLVMDVTELRPYNVSFDSDNFGSRFTGAFRSRI
jgi:Hemolysin activation/secretion protein